MPTISELPASTSVSASDTIPVNQAGILRSVSVGDFLQSVQPTITVASPSLIGRTSLGAGSPEQVDVGVGLAISGSTIVATGLDHAVFPVVTSLDSDTDLVASDGGAPQLLPVVLLRSLFSAGNNISIDSTGVISSSVSASATGSLDFASMISAQQVTNKLSASDIIPVNQSGMGRSITYANLIDGLTIDQAQAAAPAADTDSLWVAQGSNLMERQSFSAIWSWITGKFTTYMLPSIEVTANITLQPSMHNGCCLICSQAVTITLSGSLPGGFHCKCINVSSGSITFGEGFVTSTGASALAAWQSAVINGLAYSGGSAAFVQILTQGTNGSGPGMVSSLSATATSATTIGLSWLAPANSSGSLTYIVQYRVTGTSTWTIGISGLSATSYVIAGLTASTGYDVVVQSAGSNSIGPYSNIVSLTTPATSQASVPAQVSGLSANSVSATSISLSWTNQSGTNAAKSFTVQYRLSGGSTWTWSVASLTTNSTTISGLQANTSYDFSVFGVNTAGAGVMSSIVAATTASAPNAVTSITWNVPPAGPYAKGTGAIGVNAHVAPATAAIQFGVSQSSSVAPTAWTAAINVNSDLWGAYVSTPSTAGTWYMWVEGTDGSALTVYSTPFTVQ
jgi:hypothetical protein